MKAPPSSEETLQYTSRLIEKKLKDFGVEVRVVAACAGPGDHPLRNRAGHRRQGLADRQPQPKDLARSLSLVSIRVIETIPGKNLMALELPNAKRQRSS